MRPEPGGNGGEWRGATVLAVFAHPDDESLACGGTLARLAAAGARVVLICASRGERGSVSGPIRDDELAGIRAAEVCAAGRALGLATIVLLDHPDGDLRWARVPELHADILAAIQTFRPAAVITFGEDGLYWHQDHIAVHERTTTAVLAFGAAAPPLYYVTMPQGAMRAIVDAATADGWQPTPQGFWSLAPDAFGLHAAPPGFSVDVAAWVPQKLAALRCHRTQMGDGHPFDRIGPDQARRWLGVEQFRRAALPAAPGAALEALAHPAVVR